MQRLLNQQLAQLHLYIESFRDSPSINIRLILSDSLPRCSLISDEFVRYRTSSTIQYGQSYVEARTGCFPDASLRQRNLLLPAIKHSSTTQPLGNDPDSNRIHPISVRFIHPSRSVSHPTNTFIYDEMPPSGLAGVPIRHPRSAPNWQAVALNAVPPGSQPTPKSEESPWLSPDSPNKCRDTGDVHRTICRP